MQEHWKDIPNFYGKYQISSIGNCRNTKSRKLLKAGIDKELSGKLSYLRYSLVPIGERKGVTYYAHRLVYETFIGTVDLKQQVDHIDGNPKNNTTSNLRVVSRSQNCMGRRLRRKDNTSGFKGVSPRVRGSSMEWVMNFCFKGIKVRKYGFKTPEEAARYYDLTVKKVCPEYGILNFN